MTPSTILTIPFLAFLDLYFFVVFLLTVVVVVVVVFDVVFVICVDHQESRDRNLDDGDGRKVR